MSPSPHDPPAEPLTEAAVSALLERTAKPSPAPPLAVPPLTPDEPFAAAFILAGAQVITAGRAADLATFAERTGVGVLNAFTAKGLFRWDSPYHLGTGCLQERDLVLSGADSDTPVLVVGVNRAECPPALLAAAGVDPSSGAWRSLDPEALPAAAERVRPSWGARGEAPPKLELFTAIWEVAQPLYAREQAPLNPARAAADVAAVLGTDGVVCGEPGLAGWWLGRTVPTTRLGSVALPAVGESGTAVARALLTADAGAPAIAVVDAPLSAAAEALVEQGRKRGLTFAVEVWGPDGTPLDAQAHRAAAAGALASGGVSVIELAIDASCTDLLVTAAGPLVAWSAAAHD